MPQLLGVQVTADSLVLLVQTAALAFAGGKAWQLLRTHDREISLLRERSHDHANKLAGLAGSVQYLHAQLDENRGHDARQQRDSPGG